MPAPDPLDDAEISETVVPDGSSRARVVGLYAIAFVIALALIVVIQIVR